MYHHIRSFVLLLAVAVLSPFAEAQKPSGPGPAPTPAPQPGPGSRPSVAPLSNTQPENMVDEMVMFVRGRVAISDNTPVPHDLLVERVCNTSVLQQVYPTPSGDFSMQLGTMTQTVVDATGDAGPQFGMSNKNSPMGIPRRDLSNCEVRASGAGFRSNTVTLVGLTPTSGSIDVGNITVERAVKVQGATLSATPYKAPPDALKAYEKGMAAAKKGKSEDAAKYFEQAVKIYPKYAIAWFQLGLVYENEKQNEEARKAFLEATASDTRFLPPYLSLASMACEEADWPEVLRLSDHILELDPLNRTNVTGYILDLDPYNTTEAYFYNALAHFQLHQIDQAEKSALKAEHVDLRTRFPQLHLLLVEIFTQKNNYPGALSELQTYLELVPSAKDSEPIREKMAKLEKLNDAANGEKTNQ